MIGLESATKVADETWIATALLHREHPEAADFSVAEIVDRARKENITGSLRKGVYVHANTHCVANRPPNPGQYRMLFETAPDRRRLFRPGDETDPARNGKVKPEPEQIPEQYQYLLDWYDAEYSMQGRQRWLQGVFDMIGTGKEDFGGVDADAYVRSLRQDWE